MAIDPMKQYSPLFVHLTNPVGILGLPFLGANAAVPFLSIGCGRTRLFALLSTKKTSLNLARGIPAFED